jgi:hypothetical protein
MDGLRKKPKLHGAAMGMLSQGIDYDGRNPVVQNVFFRVGCDMWEGIAMMKMG